jgi:predicted TPR repeat methyltransferase
LPADRDAGEWRAEGDRKFDARDWDAAAAAYERALAQVPGSADTWYRQGCVRQEQKLDAEAARCFESAVSLDASHAKAWNNLGVSREALGHAPQAAEAYLRALRENPSLLPALVNLSHFYLRTGDYAGAAPLLERATSLDPSNHAAWESLGIALAKLDRTDEADRALRIATEKRNALAKPLLEAAAAAVAGGDVVAMQKTLAAALEILPGNPALLHMLAASRGEKSDAPPKGYVAALFDDFAENFDRKLVDQLEYRVPGLMAQAVAPALELARPARVIDLGCGTGLVGQELAGMQAEIVGIDLSAQMLKLAAQRGVYARVVKGDLTEELHRIPPASVHAVLAADVFIYVGALEPVFAAVARVLARGGLFALSVESIEDGDFRLNVSGRYAHSAAYLRTLAARHGMVERSMTRIHVRRERERRIDGWLACFAAPEG